ncbi:MAG TPA: hypothetical protein VFP34_10590 [Microlunatus sp.]|nr:hypothetical protein [Microlunatus sp.]
MTDDTDDEVTAQLRELEDVSLGWRRRYTLRVVGVADHRADLELRHDTCAARVWVALPESCRPMPWRTYQFGQDAEGWIEELIDWLNEEMDTCGIGEHAARVVGADGVPRIVTDGYGFRRADAEEHARQRRGVGPSGRMVRLSRSARRRAYALEDALDEVELQLAGGPVTLPSWVRVDRIAVTVGIRDAAGTADDELVAATGRWPRTRRASRRIGPYLAWRNVDRDIRID